MRHDYFQFSSKLSGSYSRLRRRLAATLAVLVLSLSLGIGTRPAAAADDHVFLIRGVLNIFSLGMDEMADTLRREGVHVTVANHMSWPELADKAAAEYKSGEVRNIILVGHSAGAVAVTDMIARLGQLGVPVKLAIGLDPSDRRAASGTVGRYVNYWVPGGIGTVVDRGPNFHGVLQNVDLKQTDIGHFNIEKNPAMQQMLLTEINDALASPGDGPSRKSHARR